MSRSLCRITRVALGYNIVVTQGHQMRGTDMFTDTIKNFNKDHYYVTLSDATGDGIHESTPFEFQTKEDAFAFLVNSDFIIDYENDWFKRDDGTDVVAIITRGGEYVFLTDAISE